MLTRLTSGKLFLQGIVIVGHSTGCQDAVRYAQRYRTRSAAAPLLGLVLQAPVSDSEWLASQPDTKERTALAWQMVAEGEGQEVAFRVFETDGAPMTARRWLSLAMPGGDDDMFSSSLSDDQLARIFGALQGLPTLILLSGAEEYVPPDIYYLGVGRRLQEVRL
jgi:pimeloyl-ACP methyl ester carboxylesterase